MFARVWGVGLALLASAVALTACSEEGDRGPQGAAGPIGGKGSDTTPGAIIRDIEPRHLFLGQHARVLVSVDGFRASAPVALGFGEGVTVSSVTAVSDATNASAPGGLLVVDVEVQPTAPPGLRDVTVKQGAEGSELVATALRGFSIDPPIEVSLLGGSATPGGLVRLALHDRSRRGFTTDRSRFAVRALTPVGAPGLALLDFPELSVSGFFELTSSDADAVFLIDPGIAPTKLGLAVTDVSNAAQGSFVTGPTALEVKQGSKEAIATGTFSLPRALAAPFDSKVFRVNASSPSVVQLDLIGVGSELDPVMVSFSPTGQLGDAVARTQGTRIVFPVVTADAYDTVVFDRAFRGTNGPTSTFSFGASETPATLLPEVVGVHGTASPQLLGGVPDSGAVVVLGTFDDGDGVDLYKISRAPGTNIEVAFRSLGGDLGALVAPNAALSPDATAVKTGGTSGFLRTAGRPELATPDLFIGVGPSSPFVSAASYVISIRKVP